MVLNWTQDLMCLFDVWFSPAIQPGVELPDRRVAVFLILQGPFLWSSLWSLPTYASTDCRRLLFSLLFPTGSDGDSFEAVSSDWRQVF